MGIAARDWKVIDSLKLQPGFTVCELGNQFIEHRVEVSSAGAYTKLGASRYCSIDGNGRGTHIWDLNKPLDASMIEGLGVFDLVTDFGTGEHIFDQAQVWKTIHHLTKVGGWIAFDRPVAGYDTHCYYLTNYCLYSEIAMANKYRWIEPKITITPKGKLIYGAMKRTNDAPFIVPQQRRYEHTLTAIMGGKSV